MSILYNGAIPPYIKNTNSIGTECKVCKADFANFYMRDDEIKVVKEHINKGKIMKILVIDDSPEKIERIKESLVTLVDTIEFLEAGSYMEAKQTINDNKHDIELIVCDMQFPNTTNDRIDRYCGIKVLQYLDKLRAVDKMISSHLFTVIASSSDTIGDLLEEHGFGHVSSIKASSMYDLTSQFKPVMESQGLIEVS